MDSHTKDVIALCTKASDDSSMSFPEVVMKMREVGVERYHNDLSRAERTHYQPNGESEVVPVLKLKGEPAKTFSVEDIRDALAAIQAQQITYPEFCERIAAAGCVEYIASIAGRRVTYLGRSGDAYVEHFPAAL
jgi:uncharacterized protein YbcV (DUF1398 family)